jgi:hypothetical protein
LAFHISKAQDGRYPDTKIFELTEEYKLGKELFPYIDFISSDILRYSGSPAVFDLVSLFDVIEHIVEPEKILRGIANRSRFALTMTPLETRGDWRGGEPFNALSGSTHPEGHVNFFNIRTYSELIAHSGFRIVGNTQYMRSLKPRFALNAGAFYPESIEPYQTASWKELMKRPRNFIANELLPVALYRRIWGGCWALNLLQSELV